MVLQTQIQHEGNTHSFATARIDSVARYKVTTIRKPRR